MVTDSQSVACKDQYDKDEQDDYDMFLDFLPDDDMHESGCLIESDDDDVESYNRWFLQQQRIRQERDHQREIESSKQCRQHSPQAMPGNIHLTDSHSSGDHTSVSHEASCERSKPVHSIFRSPVLQTSFTKVCASEDQGSSDDDPSLSDAPTGNY